MSKALVPRCGMVRLATAAAIVIGLGAPFGVRSAAACSPPPPVPGYGSFTSSVPSEGATDVPTNGVIILEQEIIGGGPRGMTVSVSEEATGAPVPGSFNGYYWDRYFIVWRPTALLKPQTGYRVAAAITSEAPRPASATGAAELSFKLTTGSGPVPGIEAQGKMEVRIETYEGTREDFTHCTNVTSCGPVDCTPTIVHEQRTRARVTVPAFSGGLSAPGYNALVRVTADTPYGFPRGDEDLLTGVLATGSSGGVPAGAPREVLVEDLDRLAPYRPCFALRVTDLAGTVADVDPVCVDATVQPVRGLDQAGGCRVAGSADDERVLVCLALLGLMWRRARRPSSPAR